MNVLAELSVFPIGKGESVSKFVARVLGIIKGSGIAYEPGPMGTCIEGELDDVMALIKECMNALEKDCNRIYMTLKMDYRKGRTDAMKGKLASVEMHMESTAAASPF